jgi:outer membrane protein OmpA-like peptidoglycan-associated protein
MNVKINSKNESTTKRFYITPAVVTIIFFTAMSALIQAPLYGQGTEMTKPSWWFGAAVGANFNFYQGTTQELNSDFTVPAGFRHGNGTGLFLAPVVEFHRPNSKWGGMLQVGYDSRKGSFKRILTPCNCPADLSTNLKYITIEPSLRFAPFRSNFYLFGGPRIAINSGKSFTYSQKPNPAFPDQEQNPDVKGDFSNVYKTLISMQIGAGYDIPLSSHEKQTQVILSPFVSFQPYFGQSPRSTETWTVTTLRVGAVLKLGRGSKGNKPAVTAIDPIANVDVQFSVNSPENIPIERRVRETFPLRNYVFFDKGSTEIADRYMLLTKDQVKDFKEDQLEVFTPKRLSGRSDREMTVYYNILNILGDRMGKIPSASIVLVGSSEKGPDAGKAMAESIKRYLVSVFSINASRIKIEGRNKPKIPSKQPGGTLELELLAEGDRRVSIESSSPNLLMEFQSGPDAPLKPVEIISVQEAPLDSYVTFNVKGAKEAYSSWSLEIKDDKGTVQKFGPFTQEKMSLPGKSVLGARPQGDYKVTMIGQTNAGKTEEKEANVHMVLWTPGKNEEGMRFSVIFEFNESKAINMYKKYLAEIVTPKIPTGGTVIIHGYTDIIGDEASNLKLSIARVEEVRRIIASALAKAKRTDVKFELHGFGEDQNLSPFANKYPEERFYNRTVVIDIIPKK